jgi:tRNA 2-thiocytidine biosynthesis protein TtcA
VIPILPESNPFFREDAAGFKHNERNKQSVSQKKLTKRIIRQTAQAITDFSMIEEGDKVMVAMSGGKDSYVLLDALRTLQKRAPISFELLAVTVNPHIPQFPAETLRAYFEAEGVPYHIEDQDIYSIIQKLIPEGKSVCSLCARLRRGVLYRLAGELGCTKIALGHHMDDIVGTSF